MKTKIVASSFVRKSSDGLYLIVRRSQTDTSRRGEWELPGGTVDENESITEGAVREVCEETGLSRIIRKQLLYTMTGIGFSQSDQQDCNFLFFYFMMDVSGEEDVVLSFEHDEYMWVGQEDIQKYISHKVQRAAYTHIFNNKLL